MISTSLPNVLKLNRYGKFAAYNPGAFEILAANAVSIEAADTGNWLYPTGRPENDPDVQILTIEIPKDFAAIMCGFDWGNSDNTSAIYYELYRGQAVLEEYNVNYLDDIPGDFDSCGVVTGASNNNYGVHPVTGKRFQYRIWNRTASATYGLPFGAPIQPIDVLVELAVWMYIFRVELLENVLSVFGGEE